MSAHDTDTVRSLVRALEGQRAAMATTHPHELRSPVSRGRDRVRDLARSES